VNLSDFTRAENWSVLPDFTKAANLSAFIRPENWSVLPDFTKAENWSVLVDFTKPANLSDFTRAEGTSWTRQQSAEAILFRARKEKRGPSSCYVSCKI
jgi:hypothetical protein